MTNLPDNVMMKRKHWVDVLRGLCMMAILLHHTEVYYTDQTLTPYNLYLTDALTIFFMVSGYLFYKESGFCLRKKMVSVARSLLMPYFIFTLLIALPKALAHGYSTDWGTLLLPIITGQASWFVAALCVAEPLFALTLWTGRGKLGPIILSGLSGLLLSIGLSTDIPSYPWQLDNALQALCFMTLGYCYHRYEHVFNSFNQPSFIVFLFLLFMGIKIYVATCGLDMYIHRINISNYPVFFLNIIVGGLLLAHLCKAVPAGRWTVWIAWTGSHSLVYYFLCGGIPLLTARLFNAAGLCYDGCYFTVLLVYTTAYGLTTAATWAIYRYAPFVTGKKFSPSKSDCESKKY